MIKAIMTIDDIASKNTPAIVDFLKENNILLCYCLFCWTKPLIDETRVPFREPGLNFFVGLVFNSSFNRFPIFF